MSSCVFQNIRKVPELSPKVALVCIAAIQTHRSLVRMARAVRVRRIVDVVPPCYLSNHNVLDCAFWMCCFRCTSWRPSPGCCATSRSTDASLLMREPACVNLHVLYVSMLHAPNLSGLQAEDRVVHLEARLVG